MVRFLDKQYQSLDVTAITFIKTHTATKELLDHEVRDGPSAEVVNDDSHLGIVWESSILLIEPKMCWVEVHDERRGTFGVFLEYVICRFN